MGSVFTSLSSFIQRCTNAFSALNVNAFVNNDENVDSQQDENKNYMQIQDSSRSNDSQIDGTNHSQNHVVRSEPSIESSNATTCVYNIQIRDFASNVMIGDDGTICAQQSRLRMGNNSADVYASMETEDRLLVDEETHVCTRTFVTNNIIVHADNVAIGDRSEIKVQNSDRVSTCVPCRSYSRLKEAMEFDQNRKTDQNIGTNFRKRLFSSPKQLPSPGVEPRLEKVFEEMAEIVDHLYPLRDRGKWKKFELAWNQFQFKYRSQPEIKCFLLLEESVKLTYQKCLTEGKNMAEAALNIIHNELDGVSHDVLRVFANVALASIFRRQPKKKMGKAFECLEKAKESSGWLKGINLTIPKFALALLNYEQGRCYMAFSTMKGDPKRVKAEARKFLGLSIERCRQLSSENQLYTARQSFALIYLARLYLPSSKSQSQSAKCQTIKKQSARRAKKHLKEYDRSHRHLDEIPIAARIKYLKTRSELCFLKRNYSRAKEYGCQALEIAKNYGFELETVPAQDNLDQICRHCAPITQAKLQVKHHSSSYTCSSSTTTDSDRRAS